MSRRKTLSMKRLTQMAIDFMSEQIKEHEGDTELLTGIQKIVMKYLDYVWKHKEIEL